jgi:hypothetical protein
LFSIGGYRGARLVGVVIVGRPVSRLRQDGLTAEVTRLCVLDSEPNACSFLYGKAAKAALAMGFRRIGTYTLKSEPGTSLKAAGWFCIGETRGGSWDTLSRRRSDPNPTAPKLIWQNIPLCSREPASPTSCPAEAASCGRALLQGAGE